MYTMQAMAHTGYNEQQDSIAAAMAPLSEDTSDLMEEMKNNASEAPIDFDTIHTAAIDTIRWRQLRPGYIAGIENDKSFEYVKTGIPSPNEATAKDETRNFFYFDAVVFYVAIAACIIFLLWYLKANHIHFFRRKPVAIHEGDGSNEVAEDIFTLQYYDAIHKAVTNKNYRLAIRLQYLQLLKILADKKMISYRADKTNLDYLLQLKATTYYDAFFTITRHYEYSWYGLFNISPEMYCTINQAFVNFHKRLG